MTNTVPCLNPEICGVRSHVAGSASHIECTQKMANAIKQGHVTRNTPVSVAPVSTKTMKPKKVADTIMKLDNDVWNEHGWVSRPSGANRETYLKEMTAKIADNFDVESLNENYDAIIEELEWNNAHSVANALTVVVGRSTIEGEMEKEREFYGWKG